jgi:hypothetical protein
MVPNARPDGGENAAAFRCHQSRHLAAWRSSSEPEVTTEAPVRCNYWSRSPEGESASASAAREATPLDGPSSRLCIWSADLLATGAAAAFVVSANHPFESVGDFPAEAREPGREM